MLQEAVKEKVEGTELESRKEQKMWLVRHLERIRRATLEDLKMGKELCHEVVSFNMTQGDVGIRFILSEVE